MEITKESEILDVQKVKNATRYLDEAAITLSNAKNDLACGRNKSDINVISIDGISPFIKDIDSLIEKINSEIDLIQKYSGLINEDANLIKSTEEKLYKQYKARIQAEEKAEKAAKTVTPTAVKL